MSAKISQNRQQHQKYLVLVVLILIVIIAGLVQTFRWKNPAAWLVLASGQEGGVYIELAREFETMIEKQLPNIQIEHSLSAGSVRNVELLKSGKADLALVQNDIPGSPELRTIAPLHKDYLHFIARKASGIRGFRDLQGRPFVTGLEKSGSYPVVKALLEYYSVSDATMKMMEVGKGVASLKNGESEAMLIVLGFRAKAMRELFSSSDEFEIVKLKADEVAALEGFLLTYPACEKGKMPPFAYGDQPAEPVDAITIQTLLLTRADVPKQIVKSVTEVIFSHRSELIQRHAAIAQMIETFESSSVSFPVHPGAQQYYSRDEPGFLIQYAETMAFILSLMLASYGLFTALQKWNSQRQKDRIDTYYIELEEYIGQLDQPENLADQDLVRIGTAIKEIRHSSIQQLAGEKLLPDASFRILQHLLDQCEQKVKEIGKR